MSGNSSQRCTLLVNFEEHVVGARYGASTVGAYVAVAERLLEFLSGRNVPIAEISAEHLSEFLDWELLRFSRRHGHPPACTGDWRSHQSSGITQFVRWANGRLPVPAAPRSPFEAFSRTLCDEYAQWLGQERGLATASIDGLVGQARRFLAWFGESRSCDNLSSMTVADIDAFLGSRASLRRVSLKAVAHQLRSLLRFAHATGRIGRDFAVVVTSPTLYALESIPSCLSADEIRTV